MWDGLAPGRAENCCLGGFEVRGKANQVLGCTHGPDPAPANVDVRAPVSTATLAGTAAALPTPAPGAGTNGNGIACSGDGTSGFRVEAGRDGRLFDCNDYFLAGAPATGSWLATHWHTYNSRFLLRGPLGGGSTPSNVAPTVDAGPNRSVQLGQQAALDGTVSDDGRPAGAPVTVAWAKSTGPGTVTFAGAGSIDTTAGFSVAGTYTLSLTASDTQLSAIDTMTVTVTNPNATVTKSFGGSFWLLRRSVTHTFSSGAGAMTVTVKGPSNKSVSATLRAPNGTTVGQVSGTGTRTMTVNGPVAGTYSLVMTGSSGSYTATVQHLA